MNPVHDCHVVHIDDNPRDLELLQLALNDLDIMVLSYQGVTDPLAGVRLLVDNEQTAVSLVILDLNMPVMNGVEVLTRLRRTKRLSTIPIVVFTTSKSTTDRDVCLHLGATAVISKPSSFSELREVAKKIMEYC